MKKKIFSLIISLCCMLSIFTGCNLFGTDLDRYYDAIVAKAGDFEVTKEELINGYYNYGQKLVSESGYTVDEALKETMTILLQRKMMLDYITKNAKIEEEDSSLTAEDYYFALTNTEYNDAIREAWTYVDDSIKDLVIAEYDDPANVFTSNTKADPEHAGSKNEFTQTIFVDQDGKIKLAYSDQYVQNDDGEYVFEDEDSKLDLYDYKKPTFIQETIIDEVWKEYIETLKENESYKKHEDKSEDAVLKRELDRIFKTSLENAYLTKLQESYSSTVGTENGYLTGATTQKILDKYTSMYNANKEEYAINPKGFYTNITNTSNRGNYVYFGESESIIEVQHILVKFANDESSYVNDPQLTDEENKQAKEDLNTVYNTFAKERDAEGYETGNTISVYELRNTVIKNIIDTANGRFVQGSEEYADYVTAEFNKLMYKYNEDDGILNSQFDYAIGSKGTTAMVEEFTNAAIELFERGYEGAISDVVESSYGYHIIIYTNKTKNIDLGVLSVEMLEGMKLTSTTCTEDNMLEYIYGLVKTDAYSTYEANLIATLESGKTYTYYKANYKDLLN